MLFKIYIKAFLEFLENPEAIIKDDPERVENIKGVFERRRATLEKLMELSDYKKITAEFKYIADQEIAILGDSKIKQGNIFIRTWDDVFATVETANAASFLQGPFTKWVENRTRQVLREIVTAPATQPASASNTALIEEYRKRVDGLWETQVEANLGKAIPEDSPILKNTRQKFDARGEALPFYGVTTFTTWVEEGSELFMKLVELKGNIKSELEGNGLGGKFRFVNEKTYHITLYDLIWQGDGENKADVDKKIEGHAIVKRVADAFNSTTADLEPTFEIKGPVMFYNGGILMLRAYPKATEDLAVLEKLRSSLENTTGIRFPFQFTAHITLGYLVKGLTAEEYGKLVDILRKYQTKYGELTARKAELLYFNNLEDFRPKPGYPVYSFKDGSVTMSKSKEALASNEGLSYILQEAIKGDKDAYLAIKNMNPNYVIAHFESGLAGTIDNLPEDLFGYGFGYDIRGNAMEIPGGFIGMTPANLYAIGKMLAIKYCSPGDRFLVTCDMRLHTPILRYAVVLGAASVGAQVDFSEEALSSGAHNVYSAENPKGYKVQVQMSGSHGVFQKNGAKIKADIGDNRLDPVYAQELVSLYTDRQNILIKAETRNTKDAQIQEITGIEDVIADMHDRSLPETDKNEILIIDARAGGGGGLTAKLLAKRGYEVIDTDEVLGILGQAADMTVLLGDGNNIAKILSILDSNWQSGKHKIVFMLNMHPDPLMRRGIWDPSKPEAMVPTLTLVKAINSSLREGMPQAIGGVFDGDADRVGAVKENGEDIPAFEMTIPYYQRFLLDPQNKSAVIEMISSGGEPLWLACDVRANSKLNLTLLKLDKLIK